MPTSNMENNNTKEQLDHIRDEILDNLKHVIPISPYASAEGTNLPPHLGIDISAIKQAAEDQNPDTRLSKENRK